MLARLLVPLFGSLSYVVFLGSILYATGFFANVAVPKSIDSGTPGDPAVAIVVNLALLGLFAVQHSVMARPGFKHRWRRIIPGAAERSSYVLLSSLLLLLLFWQWRPLPAVVWQATGAASLVLTALYWAGWLLVLASSYMINHFELFGLSQSFHVWRPRAPAEAGFRTPWLYAVVRHPLMLGFLVVFWAAPVMSAGHLLLALAMTLYILVGVWFEERDLVAQFGERYRAYRRRTPMLLPFGPRRTPEVSP
jgi:protein-S-isoprenylcysteine O-methyltransferase Ste14